MPGSMTPDPERLREAVASNPQWYHTIELAPGIVTPGHIDLRPVAGGTLPQTIAPGTRALDVGTFDGFWAFELERRGATVTAIDIENFDAVEWPPLHRPHLEARAAELDVALGRGFRIAAEALGSKVDYVHCSVYDLEPEAIGGPVDLAFLGSLLLHLRDPVRALERILEVLKPGGELRLLEPVDVQATIRSPRRPMAAFAVPESEFNWWIPNVAALRAWMNAAGFVDVRRGGLKRPPGTYGMQGMTLCAMRGRRPA